jgi:hypothetical protein
MSLKVHFVLTGTCAVVMAYCPDIAIPWCPKSRRRYAAQLHTKTSRSFAFALATSLK